MPQRLAQHLIARGLLPARVVDEALQRVKADGGTLDTSLLELGAVSEAGMLQALSDVSGVRLVNLADFEPNLGAATHLPLGLAQQLNIVPLSLDGTALHLACGYPVPQGKLRNLGFVLGLKIELWVALEYRIKAWQAVLYGQKLDPRYQKLLTALEPGGVPSDTTATIAEEGERLSADLLERIARGIAEEPLLLDRPRRPSEGAATDRDETIRVGGQRPKERTTYPGGVLPPRRTPAESPPKKRPSRPTLVRPAASPRPGPGTESARAPRRATPKSLPPSLPEPLKVSDPDLDFSDVGEALKGPARPPAPWERRTISDETLPSTPQDAPTPRPSAEPPPPEPKPVETEAPPGLTSTSPAEWSLDEARQALSSAKQDREQLVSIILDFGRRTFEFVGAFAVMKGAAVGWESRGGESDVRAIRQVAIPLDAASVFRTVALTRGSYIGPLPSDALTQHYLARLGRSPRGVFLWPVEVKARLVFIVYGDCGQRPMSHRRLSDFVLFCQELSSAFYELIVSRRNNARISQILPAPAEPPPAPTPPASDDDESTEGLAKLIVTLTGPDPSARAMALGELKKNPAAAAPALAKAFPGPTGWSRRPVSELPDADELGPIPGALARLEADGAAALAPLFTSSDSNTRYLALLTSGSMRRPELLDGVMAGLFDLDPDVSSAARVAAAALQGVPGFEERLPELRSAVGATDALRGSLAAKALGALHDRASVEALIALTGNPDVLLAQSAAGALKDITRTSFGTDQLLWGQWWEEGQKHRRVEWLVEALMDGELETRQAAIEELARAFGESCGFSADGPEPERAEAVLKWRRLVVERREIEL